jgi:DNA-binding MarR family transcriptional regulator
MAFDALVTSPGRLRILTALAEQTPQEFVDLRRRTALTDGNLSTHARRLESAGLVQISKHFRQARPVTTLELTLAGRDALEQHARRLLSVLSRASENEKPPSLAPPAVPDAVEDDEWVD